jgi:DNA-binding SARP family transcriptional activator
VPPDGSDDRDAGRLFLFGPMRVERGGRSTAVPRGESQRLLGYLALHPNVAHRREVLSEVLWPAFGGSRRSLSDTLYRLRRQLGGEWIDVDNDTISLASRLSVDVQEFDRLAASREIRDLEAAVALHAGELIPGIYDDWAQQHRVARHVALIAALGRLVDERERAGDLQGAVRDARRLIDVEPLDEAAHQTYLRLLGRLRRYGEALAHYESLKELFAAELDVAPLPATAEIVETLRDERAVSGAATGVGRSRFVGRTAERSLALDAVDGLFEGRGAVLGVEGVAGIGKTRLIDEVVGSARWRGATVAISAVPEVPEASPLAPLARALEPLLTAPVRVEIESRLDSMILPTLSVLHPDWRSVGEPDPPSGEDPARSRLAARVLGETLARSAKVVLVLDDMHWAGASMWEILNAIVEGLVLNGGVVIVAYRRPEIETTPGWSVLQDWDRRRLASMLSLGPLGIDELGELVDTDDVAPADVLAVTGGVPFYVTQFLDGAAGEPGCDTSSLIDGRLGRLSAEHRSALDCAAILGTSFPFRVWLELTRSSPLELAAAGDQLCAQRLMAATSDGYEFVHDLVREHVYEQVAASDRRELHERTARALAVIEPDNTRTRAYHLDRAGLAVEAAAAYRAAGDSLRSESALSDARAAWERALELLPGSDHDGRLEVGLQLAEVCDLVGWRPHDREVLSEAIAAARRLEDDKALLRGLLLRAGDAVGRADADEAEQTIAEARSLAEQLGDLRSVADVTFRHADWLTQNGQWQEAYQQFRALVDLVDRHDDPRLYGRAVRGTAVCAARMGRPTEAADWLREALETFRASGDRLDEMHTSGTMLMVSYELGWWDQFVESAEQLLPAARQLGDLLTAGIAAQALCLGALAVGDHTTARTMIAEAESSWAAAARPRMVVGAVNTLGLVAEGAGEHEEAIALYTRTIETARELGATTDEAYASHDLGALLGELGRPAEAIDLLRTSAAHWAETGNDLLRAKSEAHLGLALLAVGGAGREASDLADAGLRLFRSGEILGEHPQAWLWALSRLLDGFGRRAESDEVLDAARRELVRQSATIADPERRRGFFELVPLNRAIVAEAASRSGSTSVTVVRLAHVDAPLGRTLGPDEQVEVRWTVLAPEDDAITDPAARRRHRLQRLLGEAADRDAAPTDDDLAAALGVSRRTVLRDMAAIGGSTTRRRARSRGGIVGDPHTGL